MFQYAYKFNQPLDNWRLDKVKEINNMFEGASKFKQDLGWCLDEEVNILARRGSTGRPPVATYNCWRQDWEPMGAYPSGSRVGPSSRKLPCLGRSIETPSSGFC